MSLKKDISYITNKLIELNNCEDVEEFYVLCTGLYYRINSIVFKFETEKFKVEEKKSVSSYRTDSN